MKPKQLDSYFENWMVKAIKREKILFNKKNKSFVVGVSLNELDPITKSRVCELKYRNGYKVYEQLSLF